MVRGVSREPELQPSTGGVPPAADMEQELKVYIEHLYISPLHLSVSFLPASWADISATSGRTAAAGTPWPRSAAPQSPL